KKKSSATPQPPTIQHGSGDPLRAAILAFLCPIAPHPRPQISSAPPNSQLGCRPTRKQASGRSYPKRPAPDRDHPNGRMLVQPRFAVKPQFLACAPATVI